MALSRMEAIMECIETGVPCTLEPETNEEYRMIRIANALSQKGGSWETLGSKVTTTNVLEWDGDTTGRELFDPNGDGSLVMTKVSDCVDVTQTDLMGGVLTMSIGPESQDFVLNEANFGTGDSEGFFINANDYPMVLVAKEDNYYVDGLTLPTKGIWLLRINAEGYISFTSKLTATAPVFVTETITPIPEKYLPDSVGGGLFKIHVTHGEPSCTSDKTYKEIIEAFKGGMLPIVMDDYKSIYHLTGIDETEEQNIIFSTITGDIIEFKPDGSIYCSMDDEGM